MQALTGIKETLLNDPYFFGGGFHEIKKGGYLNIHADFNTHKTTRLNRRLNLLIYLNKNWREDYNGELELRDKNMKNAVKKIKPIGLKNSPGGEDPETSSPKTGDNNKIKRSIFVSVFLIIVFFFIFCFLNFLMVNLIFNYNL